MNLFKKIVTFSLLAFVVVAAGFAIYRQSSSAGSTPIGAATEMAQGKVVDALYFHGANRCYTCNLMEGYIRDVIAADYALQEREGKLRFQSLDVQDPQNQHYVQQYQLTSISLFFSLKDQGKELKFENIDRIWQLAGSEAEFKNYIRSELKKYLEM